MSISKVFHRPNLLENNRSVLYKNARIMDPESGMDELGSVLTRGDIIVDVGDFGDVSADEVIDCEGKLLVPGLVDIQVHFREPGQEHKETIETGSMSAVAGGVTTVVCQPNTNPVIDSTVVLNHIKIMSAEKGYNRVLCYPAVTKDMKGNQITDIETLAEHELVVGFTDDGLPVQNSLLMRRALEFSKKINKPIAQHAQDTVLSNGGSINEGPVSFELGVGGMPNAEEAIVVERDIQLLRLVGGYYHVLHVSTSESMDAIRRAKQEGLNITCEVTPHHFTLTDKAVLERGALAKMNPPLRSEKDRDSLIQAIKDGVVDCITTDHAPHDELSKNVPVEKAAFGIVGLETLLPLSLELHFKHGISIKEVFALLTYKPADIIRRKDIGRIQKGCVADLVLIDLDKNWVVRNGGFSSKSKNSPFDGREVRGRTIRTVYRGETVFELS